VAAVTTAAVMTTIAAATMRPVDHIRAFKIKRFLTMFIVTNKKK
jgi:hypothetical protein